MSITNPQIAQAISDLIDKWWTRENQYLAWLNGTATGGPYADGGYPLTGTDGVTKYVKCPAALQAQVDGPTNSASTFKDQAATSAASASTAATNAATAQSAAETARDAAQLAQQLAETAKAGAAGSEANALVYKNNAAASATDSANSAASIVGDKAAAAASAASALTSEANAAASETAAANDATASAGSAALAGKYATNPEDVIVQGTDYSAYHWAQKARAYSTGTLIYKGAWNATTSYPAGPRQGDFYIVSVAGAGYHVGDMVLYDGTTWDKVDNSQTVTSVAGRVGAVVLDKSDVGLANVLNAAQLVAANNLSDVPAKGTALANLGAYANSEVDTLLSAKASKNFVFSGSAGISDEYIELGTWDAVNTGGGDTLLLVLAGGAGYNSDPKQNFILRLNWRQGWSGTPIAGSTGNYFANGIAVLETAPGGPPPLNTQFYIVATSPTAYTFYIRQISSPYNGMYSLTAEGTQPFTYTGINRGTSLPTGNGLWVTPIQSTGDQDLSGLMPKAGGAFTGNIGASNLSGTNTGDETLASIKTKLGISTLSGANTGDQDLSWLMPKAGGAFTGAISASNLSGTNTGDQDLSGLMPKSGGAFTGDITRSGTRFPVTFVQSAAPTATAVGDLWIW